MEFKKIVYPSWLAPELLQGRTTGTMHWWGEARLLLSLIQNSGRCVGGSVNSHLCHSQRSIPQRNVGHTHTQSQSCRRHSTHISPLLPCSHECMLPNHGGGPAHGIVNSWLIGSRKNKIQRIPKPLGVLPNQIYCQQLISSNAKLAHLTYHFSFLCLLMSWVTELWNSLGRGSGMVTAGGSNNLPG